MIVDGKGQIFEDRRGKKAERRKENTPVEKERRKDNRRKVSNKTRKSK